MGLIRKKAIKPINPISCSSCFVEFFRTNTRQKVCISCKPQMDKIRRKLWFRKKYDTDESFRISRRILTRKNRSIWLEKNYEKEKISKRIRESNRRAIGKLDIKLLQMVYEDNIKKYGTLTCILCLKRIEMGMDSIEHKLPISRGGDNSYSNIGVSHLICNLRKNKKTVEEYQKLIGVVSV